MLPKKVHPHQGSTGLHKLGQSILADRLISLFVLENRLSFQFKSCYSNSNRLEYIYTCTSQLIIDKEVSQICHIFLILPQFWFSTFFWFLTPTIFYVSIHFYAFRTAIIFSRYLLYHWMYQREIKRCLLLGRKAITNLDSILKSRYITLLAKVQIVKLWFFQ